MSDDNEEREADILEFPIPVHRKPSGVALEDAQTLLTYFLRLKSDKRRKLLMQTARHFMVMEIAEGKSEETQELSHMVLDVQLVKLFEALGGENVEKLVGNHLDGRK